MRIGIVNDLALAREVLRRVVASVPGYAVAWTAGDGEEAVRRAAADPPDAVLMDLVMPNVDGAEATRRILKDLACPVLVVTSTLTGNYDRVIRAMGAGALDAVETPVLGPGGEVRNEAPLLGRLAKLAATRRAMSASDVLPKLPARATGPAPAGRPPLVLLGASTGGPDALAAVLAAFPADFPAAVLVAQHIGAQFVPALVNLLASRCSLPVRAAADGDRPVPGQVLVAATDDHLEVTPGLAVSYTASPRAYPYRPSVDVLFGSAAAAWPRPGVAVLLTGMGPDGAAGLLHLRTLGWHTIAQDEGSCVVYGMPKVAAERGAAAEVLPLSRIGPAVAATIRTGFRP
ncbi:MAG: chemotaxis response regulator protein-glutamate methylesterase [Isosphaera sp.]|nr:chemotaxis response regulator protein-glutamate methylesterase [Isosphaera sp.]